MSSAPISLDSLVLFRNARGLDGRGTLLHMTRRSVAFELYNPYSIVQLSEVLVDFRVVREGQPLYQGRAVVNSLVPTGYEFGDRVRLGDFVQAAWAGALPLLGAEVADQGRGR